METFVKRKAIRLQWSEHRGLKVVIVSEHYNGIMRMEILTKHGALWLGKTIRKHD